MYEVHKYIADDGTEFEYEEDCLDYEYRLMEEKYENVIHCFNHMFNPCKLSDPDSHYFLYLPSAELIEIYNDFARREYAAQIVYDKAGYYEFIEDEWVNIESKIEELQKHCEKIQKLIQSKND